MSIAHRPSLNPQPSLHTDNKEWLKREYTDEQVHEMLQDIMDFGGETGRMGEVSVMVFHQNLERAIKKAKDTILEVVRFPDVKKQA